MELASISDSWCTLGKTLKGRGRIWKQKRCKPYSNTELSFWSPQIRISVIERMVSTSRFRFCSVTVVFLVKTWYRYLEEREETKAYTKWVESQAQGPLSTLSTAAVFVSASTISHSRWRQKSPHEKNGRSSEILHARDTSAQTKARALPSPESSPWKLQGAREPQSWQNQRLLGCTWGFWFRIEGMPHSAQWRTYSDHSQCHVPDTGLTSRLALRSQEVES